MDRIIRRAGGICAAFALLGLGAWLASAQNVPLGGDEAPARAAPEIQIVTQGSEAYASHFALLVPDRPVWKDERAYRPPTQGPDGVPLLAERQLPLELEWNFGDGTVVTTRDQVSVAHLYPDQGKYTVTVELEDARGVFDTATRDLTLQNHDPDNVRIAAVEIDPDRSIVELTATAQDAEGDEIWLTWDFGDGETASGTLDEIWWTRHQYLAPGRYEVKLTLDDRDGEEGAKKYSDGVVEKTKTIQVVGSSSGRGQQREELDDEPSTEIVTSSLKGTVSGAVNAEIDAEVRSLYGVHLSKIDSGVCRFVFTAWDPTQLAHFFGIVDMSGIPPEGARYRVGNPRLLAFFDATADDYAAQRKRMFAGAGSMGLGGVAALEAANEVMERAGRELSDEEQRRLVQEAAKAGVDPRTRTRRDERPMPAASPHVDRNKDWATVGGELDLEFVPNDRAVGRYDLTMEDEDRGEVTTITFHGDLTVDLVAARRDGVINYDGCEPPPFRVEDVWPDDGTKHLYPRRPPVMVEFDAPYDPETLDEGTFQVAYTDPSDELVPVTGKILRDERRAYFVPDEDLLPGVEYTARVKAGDGGVLSRSGDPLEDDQGEEWRSWRFWTRLDFVPETDDSRLLACHIYQTARDVPLIAGKPAIARVWASWQEQPGVHPRHQVREFEPKLVLRGGAYEVLAEEVHRFVRPDLQEQMGIDRRAARHTAQITGWTPREDGPRLVWVDLEVPGTPGEELKRRYRAACPVTMWDEAPELSIAFFALPIDEWAEGTTFEAVRPVLDSIAEASVEYAWQLFPFLEIRGGPVQVWRPEGLEVCRCPAADEAGLYLEASGCSQDRCEAGDGGHGVAAVRVTDESQGIDGAWFGPGFAAGGLMEGTDRWPGIKDRMRGLADADVVVVFAPHRFAGGGNTSYDLRSGRGVVMTLGSLETQYFPRYVEGLVHELGHVLGLEHLPRFENDDQRKAILPVRDASPPAWFDGIEGLRMSRDGQTWWNKSSQEGNQEDGRILPLMFPGTVPTAAAFIENHHYREIQRLLDELE